MCLAQGHNAVPQVRLEPAAPRSRVKHSTTELPLVCVHACARLCLRTCLYVCMYAIRICITLFDYIYLIAYMQAYNNINYMYGNALAVLQVWRMILGAY